MTNTQYDTQLETIDSTQSQDILGRTQKSGVILSQYIESKKHDIYSFSTTHAKLLQTTLQLLLKKDTKTKSSTSSNIATLWIDNKGIKIFTENYSVSQTIVFWERDIFTHYSFVENENNVDFNIRISLKELLLFFDVMNIEEQSLTEIYILENNNVLLQMTSNNTKVKMRLNKLSDSQMPVKVFDFSESETVLFLSAKPHLLMPTFGAMEWDHKYLTFTTSMKETLIISSSSIADTTSAFYTKNSFNQFQCTKAFTARYRLSQFKTIRKAIKNSQRVTILINENKLLYIECLYESDDHNVSSEIAFYVSAQIEDYDEREEENEGNYHDGNDDKSISNENSDSFEYQYIEYHSTNNNINTLNNNNNNNKVNDVNQNEMIICAKKYRNLKKLPLM